MHPIPFQRTAILAAVIGLLASPLLPAATLSSYFIEPRAPVLGLSADGKFFAYEEPPVNGRPARIVIMDVFEGRPPVELPLSAVHGNVERVEFLAWAQSDRLVVGTRAGRVFSIGPDARGEKDCTGARSGRTRSDRADFPEILDESKGLRQNSEAQVTPDLTTEKREGVGGTESGTASSNLFGRESPIPGERDKDPKFLRVVALRPGTDRVVVEVQERPGEPEVPTALVAFDAGTGVEKALALPNRWVGRGHYLYDNEGLPRIFVPVDSGNFELVHRHGLSDWQALNELWGMADLQFVRSTHGVPGLTSVPLGFGSDPSILYVASNVGEERFGVYEVNLTKKTKARLDHGFGQFDAFEPGMAGVGPPLVRDPSTGRVVGLRALGEERATLWLDPEYSHVQALLENDFPGRSISIQCWDQPHQNFIAVVSSEGDAGRVFLFNTTRPDLPIELLRRNSRLEREDLPLAEPFAFPLGNGDLMSGYLTRPRAATVGPAPLVLFLGAGFGELALPGFDADAAALAKLGYAVARINDLGSSGIALSHARAGGNVVAEEAALKACADWLAARYPVNPRLVALAGRGYGAGIAAAVANADPARFPCAIILEGNGRERVHPVVVPNAPRSTPLFVAGGATFAAAFHDQGAMAGAFSTKGRIEDLAPADRAALVQKIADFLGEHGLGSTLPKKKWFWQ